MRRARPSLLVAALLGAPLVAGAFVSTGWSWGWDHLHRVPVAWPLLLLAALAALCVPANGRRFLALWSRGGDALAGRPLLLPLAAALLALAAFTAFPIATRMYGDSQAILNHHAAGDLALHFKRMLSLGVETRGSAVSLLHDLCERLTGLPYERCYLLLSALCGGVFVFAHLRLAATLPGVAGWVRLAIAWLGLTDGANQLFFGHVENYTVPRLFASLFLMAAVRTVADPARPPRRAALYAPLALAIVLHLQWLVLLPAGLLLLGRDLARTRPRLRAWTGGRAAAVGLGAAVLLIAAAYVATGAACYDYLYTGGRPEPRQVFLPLSTACVGLPYLKYTLLSAPHLLDLAGSLWSLSSPAALLAIAVLLRARRRCDGVALLAATVGAALVHNLVLNPSIGLPFDWDLMAVVSPPLLYTAVLLLALAGRGEAGAGEPAASPRAPAWIVPLFLLGLGTATVFAVNASAAASYRRVEDMAVWLHRTYYGNSHYRLSGNLSTIADPLAQERERVRVLDRLCAQTYPEDREVAFLWEKLGRLRGERQDLPGALAAYREALRLEPSRWTRLKEAGWLETMAGDEAAGVAMLDQYLRHAPDDAEAWRHLGFVHARAGRDDAARKAWARYLELHPGGEEAEQVRRDLRTLGGEAPAP